MPIDSYTSQCFILSQLQILELYSNYTCNLRWQFKQSKFKKIYQVFSIISSTCTGIQLIY